MSETLYRPSAWMIEAFGDQAADAAGAFARAAVTAQHDGTGAKIGSRLPTNEAYGSTVWLAFARECATELESIGAETVRPKGCRYRLGVLNRTLVLAVKLPADSRGVDHIAISSAVRRRILRLSNDMGDFALDFGDDFQLLDAEGYAVVAESFDAASRVVLLVLEGSARGGVDRVHIGDVRLGERGEVTWLYHEELPVEASAEGAAGVVALQLDHSSSFAAGDMPVASLGLVAVAGTPESESSDISEVEATGTDGVRNGGF